MFNYLPPAEAVYNRSKLPKNPYEAPPNIKRPWLQGGICELERRLKVPGLEMAVTMGLALYVDPPEALVLDC